ncbi:hypoxanthine phosphoribosyltransferase [Dasania sp. GY-MA-18]|uniref:Phosphoribosyltransferase family protein n=1 Tax=Dasania phycosphaerae TaxID=2950436 RepID=A0A9J6RP90_9GAMM|nr:MULTISPECIES: phosphoribosyltransferase family protein [Dasania]MCR8923566.1 hypoxanthine phosphoribosyltransferase [Dasania sp. GY-MA-18]MCZ0866000.1 phosphoribosyltransferase family protein [Dasania phycosphaerae]MCZ0869724.1 phosphoribosyltransferase family protein [Dasania phycosphaerae]
MPNKHYITAQQLLDDSFQLGLNILESGYIPNFIVAIWRGGTPVGIAVQELLDYCGHHADHIAIRTSLYTGIEQRASKVAVHGLAYVVERMRADDKLLIVDDVHDTGLSVQQVVSDLREQGGANTPEIRIAMPYYKPANNKTGRVPDYYLHETEQWLVFPHELVGLSAQEVLSDKPGIATLRNKLQALTDQP